MTHGCKISFLTAFQVQYALSHRKALWKIGKISFHAVFHAKIVISFIQFLISY